MLKGSVVPPEALKIEVTFHTAGISRCCGNDFVQEKLHCFACGHGHGYWYLPAKPIARDQADLVAAMFRLIGRNVGLVESNHGTVSVVVASCQGHYLNLTALERLTLGGTIKIGYVYQAKSVGAVA